MIRVTIELVSAVAPDRSRVLRIAEIANVAHVEGDIYAYNYRLSKWAPKLAETWRGGRVAHFNRKRHGPWDLLYSVLQQAVGKRRPQPVRVVERKRAP